MRTISLYILLATALATLPAQQITWLQNPTNGHWYGAGTVTTSWGAGEALATSYGGHLATIRSAAEQTWIEANFAANLGSHGLWIGFNDIATFDLSALGFPGCTQYVSDDFTHFHLVLTGEVDWSLAVPAVPGLAGLQLHVQGISHEAPSTVAISNAVTATLGY